MARKRPKLTAQTVRRAVKYAEDPSEETEDRIPLKAGLAKLLGVTSTQLDRWTEEDTDLAETLRDALVRIDDEMHIVLVNEGLFGDLPTSLVKHILSTRHGYVEKSEVKVEVDVREMAEKVTDKNAENMYPKIMKEANV